ncbi:MAG TPA: decarboxylating NADP(+)-dependent phosphogluconate dehydrogenase [Candidatus Saccharimonadales bacterium]|nr:decarboxylating NADP(+)-dependent phosphogluconate dehydrogenase [Candidatus Saccharimonadales bacterium]
MNGEQADIAVIGLAVMGQNLILNMNDHGFKVVAFNRTVSKVDDFLNGPAKGTAVVGAHTVEEMVSQLAKPRRIMMMVKAGDAVDETISHILPFLEKGDILIDGGNSLYLDTQRRMEELEEKGILYVGTGVSGGEEGARHGPSIMPGGSPAAWEHIKDIFQSIAAKGSDNEPCCEWVGQGGAGHYVKMVHNGIEYGDMQLISESYQMLRDLAVLNNDKMAEVFNHWNEGELNSYLIEITANILKFKDSDGRSLIDKILDSAGQKGTGKWTVINSAELGQPASVITEAVYSRFISSFKDERVTASKVLKGPETPAGKDNGELIENLGQALYAAKLISYTQGYMLMHSAAETYGWQLNYGGIAQMWTGGCIIRSKFLADIKAAYKQDPELVNLLMDNFFSEAVNNAQLAWRKIVAAGVSAGIPLPAMSSALAFYDAYRSQNLPANLIQAQRDFFGAHTYELVGGKRGEYFHTNWTGTGGTTSASSYNA